MKLTQKIVFSLLASSVLFSCSEGSKGNTDATGSETHSEALSGKVLIDGSSTVYPISEAIFEEYAEEQPKVKVIVNSSGTGGGFKKFVTGETDINDASRPIKGKEQKLCEENGVKYLQLTVAYDGLAVVINPKNTWASEITVEELKKIWEPNSSVTKWSDVRAEWPAEDIKLYGPGTASGTFDYFTEAIVGESGASRNDYSPNEDDNVLVNGIANDVNALGYFGLAYYEENKGKLQLVAINNGTATVKPSMETVKDGSYAPLSRPLFIYVSDKSAKKAQVNDFVKFYLDNAKDIAEDVGYIPLPDTEYDTQKKSFASFCEGL